MESENNTASLTSPLIQTSRRIVQSWDRQKQTKQSRNKWGFWRSEEAIMASWAIDVCKCIKLLPASYICYVCWPSRPAGTLKCCYGNIFWISNGYQLIGELNQSKLEIFVFTIQFKASLQFRVSCIDVRQLPLDACFGQLDMVHS